jgi:hypothetical protein
MILLWHTLNYLNWHSRPLIALIALIVQSTGALAVLLFGKVIRYLSLTLAKTPGGGPHGVGHTDTFIGRRDTYNTVNYNTINITNNYNFLQSSSEVFPSERVSSHLCDETKAPNPQEPE